VSGRISIITYYARRRFLDAAGPVCNMSSWDLLLLLLLLLRAYDKLILLLLLLFQLIERFNGFLTK